ncbi:MAG: hypothetical protein Fur0022_01490 [Anaerolineales bacterium]
MKSIGNSILLIIMLLMSASSRTGVSDDSATAEGGNVTVTGHADGAPTGCSVEEVGQRLVDFANAFNQRDSQLVPMFFGAGVWYSGSEGDHAGGTQYTTIYLGRDLPAFFERRFAQHEQILFNSIQVNGWEAQRNIVHFAFTLSRQADDLHNGVARDGVGKGAF